jgi:hypothetical protein
MAWATRAATVRAKWLKGQKQHQHTGTACCISDTNQYTLSQGILERKATVSTPGVQTGAALEDTGMVCAAASHAGAKQLESPV